MISAALFGLQIGGKKANVQDLKEELFTAIVPLQRGITASEQDQQEVEQLIQQLEKVNPNKNSLSSPLINGQWRLIYTTSDSILGKSRPAPLRPSGKILQIIDAPNGKARNQETWPFFNSVKADLTPVSKSKANVQFTQFKIFGLIPVTAPDSAKGSLDTTYLDEELRISRGDKGNVFCLVMDNPDVKP